MAKTTNTTTKPNRKTKVGKPTRLASKTPSYLKRLHPAIREDFADSVDLSTFLTTVGETLTHEDRKLLVRQALILIEQNYVHLPLKRAMHAVDPIQRLKLLLQELEDTAAEDSIAEVTFHREMIEIFNSVRDLHTKYRLPVAYEMIAYLPFLVEDYIEAGRRKYIVSRITDGFRHPTFVGGVEVVFWNGIPIERAALNNAQRYAGSNPEARHARGVATLTHRALQFSLPPDEGWVIVGYKTAAGKLTEARIDWMVKPVPPPPPPLPDNPCAVPDEASESEATAALGLDLELHLIQQIRKELFAPHVVAAEKRMPRGRNLGAADDPWAGIFEARRVTTSAGTFGYLRIRTFMCKNVKNFINRFVQLISSLPKDGLIIDVRGNGGGVILNGELILQILTPRRIEPEPLQLINSPLNLQICRANGPESRVSNLTRWIESMQQALQTGAVFSAGFPVSNPEACNSIGQKYFGPVVLITDALCYSTTDFFAAGFQDHKIGPILGVDGNTGAGGANVWTHETLLKALPGAESVYLPLPNGAGFNLAFRRGLRVGSKAGMPVEDLGVLPDERYFMTKDDLLQGNPGLINKAGQMLGALQPAKAFELGVQEVSPTQKNLGAKTKGVSRLDIYLDDRPLRSIDVQAEQTTFSITKPTADMLPLEIQGFDDRELVTRFRTSI